MTCANKCANFERCGGCPLRLLSLNDYQKQKFAAVQKILQNIEQPQINYAAPVFIPDGTRRRASFTFKRVKGNLTFGFNASKSSEIADITTCALLTPRLNAVLPELRRLLEEICTLTYNYKKGKKIIKQSITSGDVWVCDAENGVDVVLEYDAPLELEHRMVIFELTQQFSDIIRISHRRSSTDIVEPLVEKSKPLITIGGYSIYIPAGTFLQPSQEGERALLTQVLNYLGDTSGEIADLFCGVGTFSYALAQNQLNKVTAVDSNASLLSGFRLSVNKNMIPNIRIMERNLFKYPLDAKELCGYNVIVLDPPRAGAEAQVRKITELPDNEKPQKIISVSCNPHSFVTDANLLLAGGYHLQEVAFVDQFIYSNHSELVALFTKE